MGYNRFILGCADCWKTEFLIEKLSLRCVGDLGCPLGCAYCINYSMIEHGQFSRRWISGFSKGIEHGGQLAFLLCDSDHGTNGAESILCIRHRRQKNCGQSRVLQS